MLKVMIATEGEILVLRLVGHAGYAEHGKDIVCASASILANTVAQIVAATDRLGGLKSPAEIKLESGEAHIVCEPTEDTYPRLLDSFAFAKTGYMLLAHNYPQYVRLTP